MTAKTQTGLCILNRMLGACESRPVVEVCYRWTSRRKRVNFGKAESFVKMTAKRERSYELFS